MTRPDQTRPDSYDSTFFHEDYSGRKVLVLVPHQDDEINIAGNSIQNFVHSGAEVFVAFSTNGDYSYSADTRLNEAINSLHVLGVNKEHIFALGYGDCLNNFEGGHIFYAKDIPIASPHGAKETYGGAGLQDFSYIISGKHSKYCRNDYVRDIEELILHVHADIILAVDFDKHADHRMLSLCFEEAMGKILSRSDNDYFPEVFKRFAYSTAFSAELDFFADNLLQTQKPEAVKDKKIIDTSCYSWNSRVRLPIPESCRKSVLEGNAIAEALLCHVSQEAITHGESIINSDEVFFPRRTDSLTFSAHVATSSGNSDYVHDFKLVNVNDVDSDSPEWTDYLWQPESEDKEKCLSFTWNNAQKISRVVLWGNIDGKPLQKLLLKFDNGYSQELGALPENGLPLVIDIPEERQKEIHELSISILDSGGPDGGIAEVEAFTEREQAGVLKPFVQITCDDNFAYEYCRKPGENCFDVGSYSYRISEPVNYEVFGNAKLEDGKLIFSDDNDVILKVSAGNIYCQSLFRMFKADELEALHAQQRRERKNLKRRRFIYRQQNRIKKYSKMLSERGILSTIKYGCEKIISKLKGEK